MRPTTAFLIGITAAVVLTKACCLVAGAQPTSAQNSISTMVKETEATNYCYKLTGHSHLTNERVLAYLNQYPDDPSRLVGIVHDGLYTLHIQGVWDGKGLVKAKSLTSTYTLEVIE